MKYMYIKEANKLAKVIETLAQHEQEIRQYFLAELTPRILALKNQDDKLIKLFTIANADRQYKGKGNVRLVESMGQLLEKSGFKVGHFPEHSHDRCADVFFSDLAEVVTINSKAH